MGSDIEKIIAFTEQHGITAYEIAKGTGLSNYGVQKILNKTTSKPRSETVDQILDFLLSNYSKEIGPNSPIDRLQETGRRYEAEKPHERNSRKKIPIYEGESSGSFLHMFNDHPPEPAGFLEDFFDDCDFALPIWGHSMFPKYSNGDILIYKQIFDIDQILYGEAYMVVTDELRTTKYVRKSDKGEDYICLVPDNQKYYDPVDLERAKITQIFQVKGKVVKES